eukprot:5212751-Prymnesium_polylepis.1
MVVHLRRPVRPHVISRVAGRLVVPGDAGERRCRDLVRARIVSGQRRDRQRRRRLLELRLGRVCDVVRVHHEHVSALAVAVARDGSRPVSHGILRGRRVLARPALLVSVQRVVEQGAAIVGR